jgi:hypothetical protein
VCTSESCPFACAFTHQIFPVLIPTKSWEVCHYDDKGISELTHCFPAKIDILLSKESQCHAEIHSLSMELSAYKTAYGKSEQDKHNMEEYINKLQRDWIAERHKLENQVIALKVTVELLYSLLVSTERVIQGSERWIVCLIDGDGTIFASDLIARGHEGGCTTAQMLMESIQKYILSRFSLDQFQLWTHVFYNKRGLFDTLGRSNLWSAKAKLDDFMIRFNQAAVRFSMVDVGPGKELANAKIKGACTQTQSSFLGLI